MGKLLCFLCCGRTQFAPTIMILHLQSFRGTSRTPSPTIELKFFCYSINKILLLANTRQTLSRSAAAPLHKGAIKIQCLRHCVFARAIAKGACLARPAVCFMLPIDGVVVYGLERKNDVIAAEGNIKSPKQLVLCAQDMTGSSVNGDGNGA